MFSHVLVGCDDIDVSRRFYDALFGVLGWIRHSTNIQRLVKGEEPRIGAKSAAKPG